MTSYQNTDAYRDGCALASPIPNQEIVITGISGSFPDADNIATFAQKLYCKIDTLTDDERRWQHKHPEIPKRSGKLDNLDQFDNGFFGLHPNQSDVCDPIVRLFLEKSYEAIMDSGTNPGELEGTSTGVYVANCYAESDKYWFFDCLRSQAGAITGCAKSMVPNRLSYFLKLNGPSCAIDSACSSSLYALENAYRAIRQGACDKAIVCGVNLTLNPYLTLQFARLGVLSPDGACKSFDVNGDGFARSEAIIVIFLEKLKDARRVYSKISHVKTNCDGYKERGITFLSKITNQQLQTETYLDLNIDPKMINYLEAHGTGTKVGDSEEMAAIDHIFCQNRKKPFLIGSIKSNIGHTESASGLCGVTKAILAFETGSIPPNLHFTKPRNNLNALIDGRCRVVTESTPINSKTLIAINNFGFGGANGHAILQSNEKSKIKETDNLARLVCVSARTEDGLKIMLNDLKYDPEYIGLFHRIFSKSIEGYYYRGFTILTKTEKIMNYSNNYKNSQKPNIHMVMGGVGFCWSKIGKELLQLNSLKNFIEKINVILELKNLTILDILETDGVMMQSIVYILFGHLMKILDIPIVNVLDLDFLKIFQYYSNGMISLKRLLLIMFKIDDNLKKCDYLIKNEFIIKNKIRNNEAINEYSKKLSKNNITIFFGGNFVIPKNLKGIQLTLTSENFFMNFLKVLGSLYENGYDIPLDQLYPKIEYPIGRGTSMISPLIKWNHTKKWTVVKYSIEPISFNQNHQNYNIDSADAQWQFLKGHVIDGRNLVPATSYIKLIWDSVNYDQIIFENVKFKKAITLTEDNRLALQATIKKTTGRFELYHDTKLVVDGRISRSNIQLVPHKSNLNFGDYPLNKNDIYKEFKLRGYNYSEEFKGLSKVGTNLDVVEFLWTNNWCTFLDLLLQFKLLQMDTRHLYIPVGIELLRIDRNKHLEYVKNNGGVVMAYYCKETDMIKCGGVEIYRIQMVPISKKKSIDPMVLENYQFIPNHTKLTTINESIRINLQIITENSHETKLKCLNIINESEEQFGTTILEEIAKTLPKLQLEIINNNTENFEDFNLICGTNLSMIPQIFNWLKPNGFILSWENNGLHSDFNYLTIHEINNKILCLFNQNGSTTIRWNPIKISDNLDWFELCQTSLNGNILLYNNQNEPINGILGFYNCLKLEPNIKACCFVIDNTAPKFNLSSDFYQKQLKKHMNVNVYQNGTWGTYRHLLLTELPKNIHPHYYVSLKSRGDLSTFEWYNDSANNPDEMVKVHYSALNFKDVMTATNRIAPSVLLPNRLVENLMEGCEFSGIYGTERIMGIVPYGALRNYIKPDDCMTWKIPSDWSLADAATVPVVYATVLYAFKIIADLKPNQTILIHSGSGGVGQVAIRVALHHGCHVYTTVGTNAKRDFLKRIFPQLSDDSIGYSHDNHFSYWLHRKTNGRGVDCILNSLAGQKQLASIQLLAKGGIFLEIGKVDLLQNESLKLSLIKKQANFYGIMLDKIFISKPKIKNTIYKLLQDGINNGYVIPLPKTIFKQTRVSDAFKFMTTGNHIGKILLEMDENLECKSQFHCKSNSSYIIIGGLGGFGLELADWLIRKGAKNLILTTKNGLKTGYQNYRTTIWKSYGINVKILKLDASNYQKCQQILKKSSKLGAIDGIFNLAGILKDSLFINQTKDNFKESFNAKVDTTKNLDSLSRKFCKNLRYFVVFSSVCCGRGNPGQTNYGMSNSIMENICVERQKDGFPGMAIQWGMIADVGMMENVEKDVCGTISQKPENCMKQLEEILIRPEPIIGCMVLSEKIKNIDKFNNVLDIVARILGINLKTISFHSSLPELGMDSMTSIEISQALENEYQIYLTTDDLRNMTLNKLLELQQNNNKSDVNESKSLSYITKFIDDEPDKILVPLKNGTYNKSTVYCLPGTDGSLKTFQPLINRLNHKIFGFHYPKNIEKLSDIIDCLLASILDNSNEVPIIFIAHSFGTIIALELATKLEINGYQIKIICLDGSPLMVSTIFEKIFQANSQNEFETNVICTLVNQYTLINSIRNYKKTIKNNYSATFVDRLNFAQKLLEKEIPNVVKYLAELFIPMYGRIKAMLKYHPDYQQITSKTYFFKAKMLSTNNLPDDYGLSIHCNNLLHCGIWSGDHFTIMENVEMAAKISDILLDKQ